MVSTEKEKNKMALYVLFKNKNTLLFIYIFCLLFNLQMCQIILTEPVHHVYYNLKSQWENLIEAFPRTYSSTPKGELWPVRYSNGSLVQHPEWWMKSSQKIHQSPGILQLIIFFL